MGKKQNKTLTIRVTEEQKKELNRIGNGNHRHGIGRLLEIYELVKRDPAIILQKGLEHYGNLIKTFASENHYEHYIKSNTPAMLNKFNKTGKIDSRILNSRLEKPIPDFDEKEVKKDGKNDDR